MENKTLQNKIGYRCKNCDAVDRLQLSRNLFKGELVTPTSEHITYIFYKCESCGSIEVVQIDNKTTKQLNKNLMLVLVRKEHTLNQYKRARKRLEAKQKALLYKYTDTVLSAVRNENIKPDSLCTVKG